MPAFNIQSPRRRERSPHRNNPSLNMRFVLSATLSLAALHLLPTTTATKHNFVTKNDGRFFIGPIGVPYGFTSGGHFNLTVFDFALSVGHRNHGHARGDDDAMTDMILDGVEAGFLLKRFDTESDFATYYETILDDHTMCSFERYRTKRDGVAPEVDDPLGQNDDEFGPIDNTDDASGEGVFLSMKSPDRTWKPKTPSVEYTFEDDEEGMYFLMYQICQLDHANPNDRHFREIRSTFELDIAMKNYDEFGNVSYLTAGEMYLPRVFLYFSVSYTILTIIWIQMCRNPNVGPGGARPKVLPIHHMMTVLLILKTLSIFFESVRYHYIRVTGHAEFWSFVYYTFAFIKGTFLFTVILLIGSGWSFVKPFLNDREKKVVAAVLVLQVIDNVALAILNAETEGEQRFDNWSAILHLVDIICCCAVLVPIVWSVNSLEQTVAQNEESEGTAATDGAKPLPPPPGSEDAKTLDKLKLFRSFYLLVVAYVYFTRIIVYLFATMLDYHHTWLRYFVTELGTLFFYVVVGIKFQPAVDNPYAAVGKDDDAADEEIRFGSGGSRAVEMGRRDGGKDTV
mmetsp:Transcript_2253/g.4777  ORF Transcript_2253/g.4777 Transcript_2253/m.4777 type:complete len:568 (+) Transcript_2253:357-2060(+)